MERLTVRKGDMVYYRKDEYLQAPVTMSGFDVKQVMNRLAELEDIAEPMEPEMVMMQDKPHPHCPKCGRALFSDYRFCTKCGQAVKMDGKK